MENSPEWVLIIAGTADFLKREPHRIPSYKRVDMGKVGDINERPDSSFYDHTVHLINLFYYNEYDEARIANVSPFLVEGVLFNSILARVTISLAKIAELIGKKE